MREYTLPKKPQFSLKIKGLTRYHIYDEPGYQDGYYYEKADLNRVFGRQWSDYRSKPQVGTTEVHVGEFIKHASQNLAKFNIAQLKKLHSIVWVHSSIFNENLAKKHLYNICARINKVSSKIHFPEVECENWSLYRYEYQAKHYKVTEKNGKTIVEFREEAQEPEEVRYGYEFGDNIAPPKKRVVETDADRLEKLYNKL